MTMNATWELTIVIQMQPVVISLVPSHALVMLGTQEQGKLVQVTSEFFSYFLAVTSYLLFQVCTNMVDLAEKTTS